MTPSVNAGGCTSAVVEVFEKAANMVLEITLDLDQ